MWNYSRVQLNIISLLHSPLCISFKSFFRSLLISSFHKCIHCLFFTVHALFLSVSSYFCLADWLSGFRESEDGLTSVSTGPSAARRSNPGEVWELVLIRPPLQSVAWQMLETLHSPQLLCEARMHNLVWGKLMGEGGGQTLTFKFS